MRFRVTFEGSTSDDITTERLAGFFDDAIAEQCDRNMEDGEELPGIIGNAVVEVIPEP